MSLVEFWPQEMRTYYAVDNDFYYTHNLHGKWFTAIPCTICPLVSGGLRLRFLLSSGLLGISYLAFAISLPPATLTGERDIRMNDMETESLCAWFQYKFQMKSFKSWIQD